MPRERAAEAFQEPSSSEHFLAANDASPSTLLAQRLVRECLGLWLDRGRWWSTSGAVRIRCATCQLRG
jgi:hypothetical protein